MRKVAFAGIMLASGFALGAGAAKLKFPYAGKALNQPCGKTELEWRCAVQSAARAESEPITGQFELLAMTFTPKAKGLVVDVHVRRREGILLPYAARGWTKALSAAADYGYRHAIRHIGTGTTLGRPFVGWNSIAVRVYLDGRLSMQALEGKYQTVKWPDHDARVRARK